MTWISNRYSYEVRDDKFILYKRMMFKRQKYFNIGQFDTLQELKESIGFKEVRQ